MTEKLPLMKKIMRHIPFIGEKPPKVAVLDLHGIIAVGGRGKVLNLKKLMKPIEKAFAVSGTKAVALRLNSPGGSPVQSRFIMGQIRALAEEKNIPVLAFVEDVAASGGYILACAADEIFADESSIIGSIGVISSGFGFVEAIAKIGVERRVHTAGQSKSQLDPFKPEAPEQVENLQAILDALHQQFIDLVKERRGDKIGSQDDIFTGQIFLAEAAMARGLIDKIGTLRAVCRERFGEDVVFQDIAPQEKGLLAKFMASQSEALGGMMGENHPSVSLIDPELLLEIAEQRALWARYGL